MKFLVVLFILSTLAAPLGAQEADPPPWETAAAGGAGAPAEAPKAEEPEEPALVEAAREGDAERVSELLASGAPFEEGVDARGEHGRSALMAAAGGGHVEVVRALLAAGADPGATDHAGSTALFYFPPGSDPEIAELLLAAAGGDGEPLVDRANRAGQTALTNAALLGHSRLVEALLAAGAEVDHEPRDGRTALSRAVLLNP
jgi:ankyrin repeat protein